MKFLNNRNVTQVPKSILYLYYRKGIYCVPFIISYCILLLRTLIEGDSTCGLTIFWADDGLDTGPILMQKSFPATIDDTVDTLYNKYLYPEGKKLGNMF